MQMLTEKQRDDVKALLEDHQKVTDALFNIGKASWFATMLVANEDDNDSADVGLNHVVAKRALTEQKIWVEAQLKKLGIEIE